MTNALAKQPTSYDRIVTQSADTLALLRETTDIAVVREVQIQAACVVKYLEHKGDGNAIAAAGRVATEAARRLGVLLSQTVKQGRPKKGNDKGTTEVPFLPDGVSKNESSRAQQLAAVPDDVAEAYYAERAAAGKAPSKRGLMKAAAEHAPEVTEPDPPKRKRPVSPLALSAAALHEQHPHKSWVQLGAMLEPPISGEAFRMRCAAAEGRALKALSEFLREHPETDLAVLAAKLAKIPPKRMLDGLHRDVVELKERFSSAAVARLRVAYNTGSRGLKLVPKQAA